MNNLPTEILERIGCFLPNIHALRNFSMINKRFNQILSQDKIWINVYRKPINDVTGNIKRWILCNTEKRCFECFKKTTIYCELMDVGMCMSCHKEDSHISRTRAMREYSLCERDFDIPFEAIKCQYNTGVFYLKRDVESVVIKVYGSMENFNKMLEEKEEKKKMLLEKRNVKEIERKEKIKSLYEKYNNISVLLFKTDQDEYIRKGVGIRKIERNIKKHIEYMSIAKVKYSSIYNDFINDKINKETLILRLNECERLESIENNRKIVLIEALKKNGLEYRSESYMCKQYISGETNDLDNVVSIAKEMNWFCTYTNYLSLVQRNLNRHFENLEHYERQEYRYNPNLKNMMIESIKYETKQLCLQIWIKIHGDWAIPDFLIKYQVDMNVTNNIQCICGNIASSVCTQQKCKRCCFSEDCKRHKKNII